MALNMEQVVRTIKHIAHDIKDGSSYSDGKDLFDDLIRTETFPVVVNVPITGTIRCPVGVMQYAGTVLDARFVPDTGMAAGANTKSLQLRKHDGAGGGTTNLSTLYDGTTTAITADQENVFAGLDATDTFAAGDVLEVNITTNGTGTAMDTVMIQVRVRYA